METDVTGQGGHTDAGRVRRPLTLVREVVVGQDHHGGFIGNSGDGDPHGEPMEDLSTQARR